MSNRPKRRQNKRKNPNGQVDLGRGAESPSHMPLKAWRYILLRTWRAIADDRLSLLAAGVAFYALFAVFPGLAALISLFGLLADPASVQRELDLVKDVLPAQAWQLIANQLLSLTSAASRQLSITGLVSLAIALFSARLAAYAMIDALNAIYKERETRSILFTNALALLYTFATLGALILSIAIVIAFPIIFRTVGLDAFAESVIRYTRWPVLAVMMFLALSVTYRVLPNRRPAKWRWLTFGSLAATIIWVAACFAFSWYVEEFNTYDRLYGSLGAVIILLFWFWLTAFAALLGAELDMQIEHQTAVDSTVGGPKPMGQRGAYAADTVAEVP
jgi:membrane protein